MKDTNKSSWSEVEAIVDAADVLLVVLDARDPQRCKSKRLERLVQQKKNKRIVYVLNKIDLVPRRNAEGWIKSLSQTYPTVATSAMSSITEHPTAGIEELGEILVHFAAKTKKASITVGVVGYVSVGRSSLVKALKQSNKLSTQKGSIKLNETPATLPNTFGDGGGDNNNRKSQDIAGPVELLLRSKIITPEELTSATESIVMRCKKETLLVNFALPMFDDGTEFLCHLARQQGNILKGGVPDIVSTARSFLREITTLDKLPFYTSPPRGSSSPTTPLASTWIKEFGTSVKASIQTLDSLSFPIDGKLAVVLTPQELQEDGEEDV
ncbi:MAG: P-loop containing nucleoside triphosphate hydrolase protein [Benniella sp.]|nr:MAG: P-loop containing nucleoside triphosphate hydrolase protein [Benniella sp.]